MVEIKTKISNQCVNYKAGGFADDINIICRGNQISIRRIFWQYERLTRRSGLTLNADKTEILVLHTEDILEYEVEYEERNLKIKSVGQIKICGIWFCNEEEEEYNRNIEDKMDKLEHKIKLWNSRNLTFEGKILIIKTFGISQLIYVMQVCKIKESCMKSIERIIFGFIWRAHKSERERGIDRIKRSVLKNKYVEGGLNVTDIECLDRSLKTRQFVRADKSNHPIKLIQLYCIEIIGQRKAIDQGYAKITENEDVTMIAQSTIGILNQVIRKELNSNIDAYRGDPTAVNYAGSINIKLFLKISNNKLIECVYGPLLREGVETLHELVGEVEIEHDRNRLRRLRMVLKAFPVGLVELASTYNEDNNADINAGYIIMGENKNWLDLNKITTKEMQAKY